MDTLHSIPFDEFETGTGHVDTIQALPPDWVSFLEPAGFVALQCAAVGHRLSSTASVAYWSSLCAARLDLPARHVVEIGMVESSDPVAWSRTFRTLSAPGLRCELLHRSEEYAKIPMAADGEVPPEAVEFMVDDRGLCTRCRLRPSYGIGGNRIVVASTPLPALGASTPHAYVTTSESTPDSSWTWRILPRSYNYYEVSLLAAKESPSVRHLASCVSVGLCTQQLPAP